MTARSAADRGEVGVILVGDRGPEWADQVRRADQAGFSGIGVADSPSIYPDVYVRLAVASGATENALLGPWVTNPLTRHPAVTAGAIVSIDELSGGRAFLGIGTGDSAAKNIGRAPATLDHLEDYVRAVNELQTEGRTTWDGATCSMTVPQRRVPVWMAVSGPKSSRLAGRIADGVIVGSGLLPELVEQRLHELGVGADEAQRDPAEITVWWLALANLAEDDETALEELKGSLAAFGHMATRSPALRATIEPALRPAMERLHREYDSMQHATYGESDNARLVDELGLTDELRRRFAVCGSPDTFVTALTAAHDAGARNLWFSVRVPGKDRFLRLWETEIRRRIDPAVH